MPTISERAVKMPASPIRKLGPLADAARKRGVKIYQLNIGQPDLPTPQEGLDALKSIDRKLLEYSYGRQLKDIFPSMLLAVGMGAAVWCVKLLGLSDLLTLCLQVPLGAAIYIGGAWLLKLEPFLYILKMLKGFLANRKK